MSEIFWGWISHCAQRRYLSVLVITDLATTAPETTDRILHVQIVPAREIARARATGLAWAIDLERATAQAAAIALDVPAETSTSAITSTTVSTSAQVG